jgi:hypothetical protein
MASMELNRYSDMSEPISGAAGGFALSKAIPILGPILATIIVMCMATPKSRKELAAALTSTVAMSLFGGSMVVEYFKLDFGTMATTGVAFICGLPAWLVVRALFAWMEKQKDKDLAELAKAVAKEVKDLKN